MSKSITILLAPDSFKESLSSRQICEYLNAGIQEENAGIKVIIAPIADGGEGTVAAFEELPGVRKFIDQVTGPLGNRVTAEWVMRTNSENTAIIEMASAAGLPLVPAKMRNPMITTTFGLGELILKAVEQNTRNIIIGLGGSATNDGGSGMLQALGFSLLDKKSQPVIRGNAGLDQVHSIDARHVSTALKSINFVAASDVRNPLTGPDGATCVYGPQKGATPEMVEKMDQNMRHFADIVNKWSGHDWSTHPGAGAAGGLGFAFLAFLNSRIQSGFEIIAQLTGLEEKIREADWVVTGEGKLDNQTLQGKGPFGVAQMAKKNGKPVIAIGGMIDPEAEKRLMEEFDGIFKISPPGTIKEDSIKNAGKYLVETGRRIARYIQDLS